MRRFLDQVCTKVILRIGFVADSWVITVSSLQNFRFFFLNTFKSYAKVGGLGSILFHAKPELLIIIVGYSDSIVKNFGVFFQRH